MSLDRLRDLLELALGPRQIVLGRRGRYSMCVYMYIYIYIYIKRERERERARETDIHIYIYIYRERERGIDRQIDRYMLV